MQIMKNLLLASIVLCGISTTSLLAQEAAKKADCSADSCCSAKKSTISKDSKGGKLLEISKLAKKPAKKSNG